MFKDYINFGSFIGFMVVLIIVLFVIPPVIRDVMETHDLMLAENDNPFCVDNKEREYCNKYGMELSYKIITPSGLFGGSPYEQEMCIGKLGEKLIKYKEIDFSDCINPN